MERYNLMLEFESLGELYFRRGSTEGKNFGAQYRCYYSVVNWKFRSEKFERWDELSSRWIQCQLGEPMSKVFHEYQQQLLDDERDRRLGIQRHEAA